MDAVELVDRVVDRTVFCARAQAHLHLAVVRADHKVGDAERGGVHVQKEVARVGHVRTRRRCDDRHVGGVDHDVDAVDGDVSVIDGRACGLLGVKNGDAPEVSSQVAQRVTNSVVDNGRVHARNHFRGYFCVVDQIFPKIAGEGGG